MVYATGKKYNQNPYTNHALPEGRSYASAKYEKENLEETYHDTTKDELLYKIASRAPKLEDEREEKEPIDKISVVQKASDMVRDDDDDIKKLRINSGIIVGNLFDRVKFLGARIGDLEYSLELRKKINSEILMDIETDIADKESFATRCCDLDDLRSIKLHISMLKQQKRRELVQNFHDVLTISTEIRALREELESERKITSLFEGL